MWLRRMTKRSSHLPVPPTMLMSPTSSIFHRRNVVVLSTVGTRRHFCYDRSKFISFTPIPDLPIATADGRTFKAIGTGDVRIDHNGAGRTSFVLKDAVYAPQMALPLSQLGALREPDLASKFRWQHL